MSRFQCSFRFQLQTHCSEVNFPTTIKLVITSQTTKELRKWICECFPKTFIIQDLSTELTFKFLFIYLFFYWFPACTWNLSNRKPNLWLHLVSKKFSLLYSKSINVKKKKTALENQSLHLNAQTKFFSRCISCVNRLKIKCFYCMKWYGAPNVIWWWLLVRRLHKLRYWGHELTHWGPVWYIEATNYCITPTTCYIEAIN